MKTIKNIVSLILFLSITVLSVGLHAMSNPSSRRQVTATKFRRGGTGGGMRRGGGARWQAAYNKLSPANKSSVDQSRKIIRAEREKIRNIFGIKR